MFKRKTLSSLALGVKTGTIKSQRLVYDMLSIANTIYACWQICVLTNCKPANQLNAGVATAPVLAYPTLGLERGATPDQHFVPTTVNGGRIQSPPITELDRQ